MTLTPVGSSSAQRSPLAAGEALSFDRAPLQVERMITQGVPFGRVEEVIDAAPFASLHKSSLWLLAWSLRDPAVQRQDALLMTRAFAADESRGLRTGARSDFDPPSQA